LSRINTLGFRGEALASIASVARIELITQIEGEAEGTRVVIEGGRMRDVAPAARPRGTTIAARDLFFNVPARRKFLRSEATESYHLTNLVTHYALAHPEIAFTLTNSGREILRAAPASDLRERAYQIFGAEFLESLLEVDGGQSHLARVRGYVSAPRERRTSRDAQYLFVNGRFVRDRLVSRALGEGYRSVLPHGVFPAALLFLEVPPEEVDVNVHPAKTEVRFRRASAVADTVRDAVRAALATGGYLRIADEFDAREEDEARALSTGGASHDGATRAANFASEEWRNAPEEASDAPRQTRPATFDETGRTLPRATRDAARQEAIEFGWTPAPDESLRTVDGATETAAAGSSSSVFDAEPFAAHDSPRASASDSAETHRVVSAPQISSAQEASPALDAAAPFNDASSPARPARASGIALPPLNSAAHLVREMPVESLSADIRPLGQLDESFIIATDPEGLLLIDQHVAHERILFDKYRRLEGARAPESQNLLVPETFDLTPAQAAAFDAVSEELERHGFALMRLSGRTVAVRAVPADLPASEARNLLAEILDAVDAEKRTRARDTLRDEIAASLACRAAIKINMPLTDEKMRWLIDRLLLTSSPTTCPHGRPIILRLTKRDIERGFHRP
jgi:DNA mismatch repair protein MutL